MSHHLKQRYKEGRTKKVIVDGRDHLLGRLASIVAKQLLEGNRVVIVRAEGINMSGALHRNTRKFANFKNKRTLSNPKWGPFHHRAPSRIVYRAIRGMVPHKLPRGAEALGRLEVYEGIPPPYDTQKRMVVPEALRVLRLKPGRKWCYLGDVSAESGWKYQDVITRMEDKRKVRSYSYYLEKKAANKALTQAVDATKAQVEPYSSLLQQFGY